jgi:ectoine hydroxylase-related dioxygenase (phytanoyl-CoA dioxygenase family)
MDKIRTLKFFIYLTDTTEENGAMGAVPGSQVANCAHRLECLKSDPDYRAVTNVMSDAKTVPVEGPAGTLFIFDSDITHSAGHVRPGKERRILRGHTRTVGELKTLGLHKQAVGTEA